MIQTIPAPFKPVIEETKPAEASEVIKEESKVMDKQDKVEHNEKLAAAAEISKEEKKIDDTSGLQKGDES